MKLAKGAWLPAVLLALGPAGLAFGDETPKQGEGKQSEGTPKDAKQQDERQRDTKQGVSGLSLQELMNLEVTTTSKKSEPLFGVPAAAYVISSEEIHASGARNLPDLLRMVPGITVQQTNSNQWSVASRGFIDTFTNKLLVMVDGRSLYTPTFGGVVWGNEDMILDNIERIEVIRGPGGSIWGFNAVTGIINIITKNSSDTLGSYAEGGLGDFDTSTAAYRWGQKIDANSSARFYLKYKSFDESTRFRSLHLPQNDAGSDRRAGFRYDRAIGNTTLLLEGEASGTHYGQVPYVASDTDPSGLVPVNKLYSPSTYHLLGRFTRTSFNGTIDSFQAYFDHATRNIIDANEIRDTLDVEAQRSHAINSRTDLVIGAGFRSSKDQTNGSQYFYFVPEDKRLSYFSLFGQLSNQLSENSKLVGGLRLERNDYTGWEIQPSIRYSYTPDNRKTIWAAISRSVRTPTRFDRESFDLYYFDPDLGAYNAYIGSDNFKSEKQLAYEAGIKLRPSESLTLDIAGFFNHYTDLRGTMAGAVYEDPNNPGTFIQPNTIVNGVHGNTSGVEIYGKWDAKKNLRLFFSYAYFAPALKFEDGVTADPTISITYTPRHAASLIADWRVNDKTNFDLGLYWQDGMGEARVPPSTRVDLNLRYSLDDRTEAVFSVQNASQKYRFEGQTTDFTYSSLIPRSVYFGLRTRY